MGFKSISFLHYLILAAGLWLASTSVSLAITVAPGDLNPGDSYRLAFVTSTVRDATSSDIAVYNNFVTTVADSVSELADLGTTWSAIASTPTVSARDNTGTNPTSTGVPIYLLNATRIADDNQDLWDGVIDFQLNITQLGGVLGSFVWTGTSPMGVSYVSLALGGSAFIKSFGSSSATDTAWIDSGGGGSSNMLPLYAISDELTLPATIVPTPSALFLLGSGLLGLIGVARGKTRS